MKLLTKIQIVLAVLFGIGFIVYMEMMAGWFHSTAYADPVRREWPTRLDVIGNMILFGTLIPWALVTIYHSVIVIKGKVTGKDSARPTAITERERIGPTNN